MSFTVSLVLFFVGAAASGFVFRFLRHSLPEAVANGLAVVLMSLAFYPLVRFLNGSGNQFFLSWVACSILGGLTAMGVFALLNRKWPAKK
jgi:phosphate/sulfate permease